MVRALRDDLADLDLPQATLADLHALVALGDQHGAALRDLHTLADDAGSRVASVRDGAMGLAMVPVRRVVAGFPQLVRELAGAGRGGEDVDLVLRGQDVELDTRVLDAVADSLRHLVTNAVDHGCETPAARVAHGKPGGLHGHRRRPRRRVDGGHRGLRRRPWRRRGRAAGRRRGPRPAARGQHGQRPGPAPGHVRARLLDRRTRSPAARVAVSGWTSYARSSRTSPVRSRCAPPGAGTTFVITLPVTLGVLRCLLARVGDERYALPVAGVVETIGLASAERHEVAGVPVVVREGRTMPVVDLGAALDVTGERDPRAAVVVHHGAAGELLALAVDDLEGEREVVVKELGGFLGRLPAVAGATIDGDGSVLLVLDVRELAARQLAAGPPAAPAARVDAAARRTAGAEADRRSAPGRGCSWSRTRWACASCSG